MFLPYRGIPYVGKYMQAPFSDYLEKQKSKLHRMPGQSPAQVRQCRSTSDSSLVFWFEKAWSRACRVLSRKIC